MKKLLNNPNDYADQTLEGLCLAHPEFYTLGGENRRVIHRPGGAIQGKVGIVSGGGSGHLPVFTGYCGEGLLDACSIGNVFAGPSVADCVDAMKIANGGAGVLRLYGNYGGDRMNFDMAGEMLEMEGIDSTTVLVADDVASAPPEEAEKRRGVAGQSDPSHRNEFLNHYPHPRRGQSHFFTTWRDGNWKVIYQYLAKGNDRYALYDLASDPSESNNLAAKNPEKLKSMMQGMVRELDSRNAVYPVKDGQTLEPVTPHRRAWQNNGGQNNWKALSSFCPHHSAITRPKESANANRSRFRDPCFL